MVSSKSRKSNKVKEEVEAKVNDDETTRLDKTKGRQKKTFHNPAQDFNSKKHPSIH